MTRTLCLLLAAVTVVALSSPFASAQVPRSNPVAQCSQECLPSDDDVNGKTIKRGAESARVILYGHFENLEEQAPLNTQLVDPDKEFDVNRGFLFPTLQTATGADEQDLHFRDNFFNMYSSPGLVEIFDGEWRTHQEPGLAEDVVIASEKIHLYWYMSAHAIPTSNSAQSPGTQLNLAVMPEVAVKARMETGRIPYSSKSTVIAEGDTGKGGAADLLGGDGRVNMVSLPNADPVYEFKVPMSVRPDGRVLPNGAHAGGFIVSVHPYQLRDPGAGDKPDRGTEFMQADWRVRTGANFPPRLVFDVANPMMTKDASLTLFNDHLFVRWTLASPWGTYDMSDRSLSLAIEGPSGIDSKEVQLVLLKRSVEHDGHFYPVTAAWKLDLRKLILADGEHKAKMSIENLQRTYLLEHELPFTVVQGVPDVHTIGPPPKARDGSGAGSAQSASQGTGTPGFEAALLLPALLGVGTLARRGRP